jgi:catechol 2,3-dioxygenase-like lactoylglutathione lyase family enzyme
MRLGAFSISLSVKDLKKSKAFYESLGFTVLGGNEEHHYLIMKNGNALVGLFQGMFEGNILTFNPGWDESGQNLPAFDDVRVLQAHLKANGISLDSTADTQTTGPAHITLKDPDGNAILIDQRR